MLGKLFRIDSAGLAFLSGSSGCSNRQDAVAERLLQVCKFPSVFIKVISVKGEGADTLLVIDPVRNQGQMSQSHGFHCPADTAYVGSVLSVTEDYLYAVQIAVVVHALILCHIARFSKVG